MTSYLLAIVMIVAAAAPSVAQTSGPAAAPTTPAEVEARDLFRQIVEIPTVEGRGEMPRLVALVSEKFRAEGLTDITVKSHRDTQTMIVRWPAAGPTDRKPILLMAHMDVVEARREDWADDPFVFREKDGYYWGRGTSDNKAGIVEIMMSLFRLKRDGFAPARDIVVLFTGDEETRGDGARLAATEWRSLVDAEYALNSDGGGGAFARDGAPIAYTLQSAEKTYRTYTLTVRNRGGHSSKPRPDNAIYELSAALGRLAAHRFTPQLNETTRGYFAARARTAQGRLGETMRRWLADERDEEAADMIEADETEVGLTRTRCVATRLEGGHADNALPQMARATVNCRIMPGVDPAEVMAELADVAGPGVTVAQSDAFGDSADASPLRPDVVGAYTHAVQRRFPGMPIVPQMSTGATDGVFFRAVGIPVYGVSGVWIVVPDDQRAHGLDERVPIRGLHDGIAIWEEMIRELAG